MDFLLLGTHINHLIPMKSQLLLFQRKPEEKEIAWIKEQYPPSETTIYLERSVARIQELDKYEQHIYHLDERIKKEANKAAFKKILQFGDARDRSKFSHAQQLQYQHLNLWYYNKFRVYFWLREIYYQRERIMDLQAYFENITLFSDFGYHGVLVNMTNVNVISSAKSKGNNRFPVKYLFNFILRSFINRIVRQNPVNKYLVISPSERVQPMLDLDLNESWNDPFFGYLFAKYPTDFTLLDEIKPGNNSTGLLPGHHKGFVLGEAIMMRALFSPVLWKEWSMVKRKFKRILHKMANSDVNDVNLAIIHYLQHLQGSHNYYLFRYLAYRRFFRRKKVKAVIATDENSMFTKVVLDAAKAMDILTIGMQHGNVHSLHPAYMFSERDIELHPMPDYTFIWGDLWKEVLMKEGNYPEEELVITGQLRTDIIPKMTRKDEDQSFTMVFASQPQTDESLRKQAALDVFQLARDLNLRLRIKLHPRETDPEYYKKIASEAGLNNMEFTGNEDLYEVILNSDLVITCYSTVGAETAYFKKPLIILDYLREDINYYARDGIAFQCKDLEEMKNRVIQIKNEGLRIEDVVYERYISKCAYKIDGKVSKRMMDWLRLMHPITSHSVE